MTAEELKAIRERNKEIKRNVLLFGGRTKVARQVAEDIDALTAEVERLTLDATLYREALIQDATPPTVAGITTADAYRMGLWASRSPRSNLHSSGCQIPCLNPAHYPANYPDDFTPED